MSLLAPADRCLIDFLSTSGAGVPSLRLVDVGVSGGLHPAWRRWGAVLHAVGVDTLVDEVERLSSEELNPNVRYFAARLTGPAADTVDPKRTNYSLHRTQPYLASVVLSNRTNNNSVQAFFELQRDLATGATIDPPLEANFSNLNDPGLDPFYGYYSRRFARAQAPRFTQKTTSLDHLLQQTSMTVVDVLKIDTDGHELDVLRGAERTLQSGCLAIEVEVQFHGRVSSAANTFCNIDTHMRERGFTLFRLVPVHYSRAALPRPFVLDIPAQTSGGQIFWADALYARDLGDVNYAARFGMNPTRQQCRQLALVFDLYGLEDSAAEILLANTDLFEGIDNASVLDFLSTKLYGPRVKYTQVIKAFMKNPLGFQRKLRRRWF